MNSSRSARSFLLGFWVCAAVTACLPLILAHARWTPAKAGFARRPSWFWPKGTYLSNYTPAYVPEPLYLFGFFGTGRKIREADIILTGTSHMEVGVSAESLSRKLSAEAGRQVKVYNLGLGCGEGWGFIFRMLEKREITGKTLIIDLFNPQGDNMSPYARTVVAKSPLQNLLEIGKTWADYARDAFWYPYIPSLHLVSGRFYPTPFLIMPIGWRSWDTGDFCGLWFYNKGIVSFAPSGPDRIEIHSLPGLSTQHLCLAPLAVEFSREARLAPVLTLLPYPASHPDAAAAIADRNGYPFLRISSDGIVSWDREHIATITRETVTERLFQDGKRQGIWPR